VTFWIDCAVVEADTRPPGARVCIMWNTDHGVSILLVCFLVVALALTSVSSASAQGGTPRYVIYYNSNASPPETLIGTPYTHVILSFITVEPGAPDDGPMSLVVPSKLAPALAVIGRLQAQGKRVLISFGGGDMRLDAYTGLAGREESLVDAIAAFVSAHGLDGVDIDFEVSAVLHSRRRPSVLDGRRFLIDLTAALHKRLPAEALISRAPQAPYLDPAWHGAVFGCVARRWRGRSWTSLHYRSRRPTPVSGLHPGRPRRPSSAFPFIATTRPAGICRRKGSRPKSSVRCGIDTAGGSVG
jgi:hypothetical protein